MNSEEKEVLDVLTERIWIIVETEQVPSHLCSNIFFKTSRKRWKRDQTRRGIKFLRHLLDNNKLGSNHSFYLANYKNPSLWGSWK